MEQFYEQEREQNFMKKNDTAYGLAVLLSGCLWGLMGFFRRRMGDMGLSSFGVVLVRCGIAAVLFAVTILVTDPASIQIKWKDAWCFVGSGLCSLLFFSVCYFQAMTMMSLSAAAILLYTAPCFVILMSAALFREKITGRKLVAMVLAFVGCCLVSGIVGADIHITTVGLLYGLGAGFGYALYSIFGKLAMARGYKSNTINFWSCLLAALGAGIVWGFAEPAAIAASSVGSLLFCIAAAVVTTYLPYLLYTYGLSGVEAGRASVMASIEPVVATIVGMAAFGEKLTTWSGLGIVLVLLAIVLLNRPVQNRRKKESF